MDPSAASQTRYQARLTRQQIINAQLRLEKTRDREPLSRTIPDLIAHMEKNARDDFLLNPSSDRNKNLFDSKSGTCVVL